jgi:FtsP/CotA-like multicopper oxidase with cupredoxin domain
MHIHGHHFKVVATDGSRLLTPFFKNTINVAPGETWDIEFEANNPGTWLRHLGFEQKKRLLYAV